jgi:hypothetical protein
VCVRVGVSDAMDLGQCQCWHWHWHWFLVVASADEWQKEVALLTESGWRQVVIAGAREGVRKLG